jgi:hypothetical protein
MQKSSTPRVFASRVSVPTIFAVAGGRSDRCAASCAGRVPRLPSLRPVLLQQRLLQEPVVVDDVAVGELRDGLERGAVALARAAAASRLVRSGARQRARRDGTRGAPVLGRRCLLADLARAHAPGRGRGRGILRGILLWTAVHSCVAHQIMNFERVCLGILTTLSLTPACTGSSGQRVDWWVRTVSRHLHLSRPPVCISDPFAPAPLRYNRPQGHRDSRLRSHLGRFT